MLTPIYITISCVVIMADMLTACLVFGEHKKHCKILGCTCIVASVVQLTYLLSVLMPTYFLASVMSSLYFVSISVALSSLLTFIRINSNNRQKQFDKTIKKFVECCVFVDALIFLINPFCEISMRYSDIGGQVARFQYDAMPLYAYHLVLAYSLFVFSVYHLVRRTITAPREYRTQYVYTILMLLVVVGINALFLFVPSLFGTARLDFSIWGYSIASFSLYLAYYRYPYSGMKPYYNSWIVENVNQAVALFNYEDELLIVNDNMRRLFPDIKLDIGMKVEDFVTATQIDNKLRADSEETVFQTFITSGEREYSVRVERKILKSQDSITRMGQLFVFTDKTSEIDVLTSFHSWEAFRIVVKEEKVAFAPPLTVAVCDINGLSEINAVYGKNVGDQAIELLANTLRKHFTGICHFVRGNEANLIVLCFDIDEDKVKDTLSIIHDELITNDTIGCVLNIQSAVACITEAGQDIFEVVEQASKSMRNKKLLDVKSRRSELVMSLVKTLSECDNDTEEHVKRTQLLGAELGKRLGLTDMQQSDLALLCLLHDIGKIGIPLEILNKPGKLDDSEWRMMKTHTSKGYQIATSSQELSHIADMILHHHESWDGRGYPDGLSKEAIPLLSRIISVVDAYDAMVNDRAYRAAMSVKEAVAELKRCAGKQFDPTVVNEFIRILPNIDDAESEFDFEIIKAATSNAKRNEEPIVSNSMFDKNINIHPVAYSRYIIDDKMRIIEIDEQFEILTGYTSNDIHANEIYQADIIPEEDVPGYLQLVTTQLSKKPIAYFEHRIKRKDGTIFYVFCCGRVFFDSAVKAERSEVIIFDSSNTYSMGLMISEVENKAEIRLSKWEDKYRCDSLTGLLTHEAFKKDVESHISNSNSKIMLLMMDIDKFKEYNDNNGHRAGDEFLTVLSHALTGTLRKDDLACRMGGDEFAAALFFDATVSDDAMIERAQQICDKINIILTALPGGTSLSMGVVISDSKNMSFDKLYERSDKALYDAKSKGKSRMTLYEED